MAEFLIVWLVVGPGLLALGWWGRRYLARKQGLSELELTPPLGGDPGASATTNLCLALTRLIEQRPLPTRLFGFYPTWQLLIRADKQRGCRFIWRLPAKSAPAAERLIAAYWPGVQIKAGRAGELPDLKLVARFGPGPDLAACPAAPTIDWQQSDPLGYLTSQLTTVSEAGPIGYAIDLRPRAVGLLTGINLASWLLGLVGRLADSLLTLTHPATVTGTGRATQTVDPPPAWERPELSVSIRLVSSRPLSGPALSGLQSALGLIGLKHKRFGRWSAASSSQLGQLWHFPNSASSPADDLTHSLSRTLPLPTALLPGPGPDDLVIGTSNHRGSFGKPIYLTPEARQRHVYIVGGTGTGKTTMMKDQIIQDMRAGRGVGVIDPHGDLASELLDFIPPDRIDDLVYIDPDNCQEPTQLNLLEIPSGLSGFELERQKDLVTESTVSVLRKLFANDGEGGHRIEYILRNSIQTALTLPDPTLFTIYDLLQAPKVRRQAIAGLDDEHLKLFWQQELGRAGEYQRVKMTAGVTAKIGRFLFSTPTRLTFGAPKSNVDFLQIMDEGKILICDLSRGKLGEDTSRLFGSAVLAKIQLAALARARQPFSDRQPFYLHVDEFQNFATTSFVEMMSESRKYQVLLTIAEQSTQQQFDQKLIEVILANVGTVVTFRLGSPEDVRLLEPIFAPCTESFGLTNLPIYNFRVRLGRSDPTGGISGITRLFDSC